MTSPNTCDYFHVKVLLISLVDNLVLFRFVVELGGASQGVICKRR